MWLLWTIIPARHLHLPSLNYFNRLNKRMKRVPLRRRRRICVAASFSPLKVSYAAINIGLGCIEQKIITQSYYFMVVVVVVG